MCCSLLVAVCRSCLLLFVVSWLLLVVCGRLLFVFVVCWLLESLMFVRCCLLLYTVVVCYLLLFAGCFLFAVDVAACC